MELKGETDCIYKSVSEPVILKTGKTTIKIDPELKLDEGGRGCSLEPDVVVWNPWVTKSAKMGDFGDEEWRQMVCVEPGHVSDMCTLRPFQTLFLKQTLAVVGE